jgi:hypothetical protein
MLAKSPVRGVIFSDEIHELLRWSDWVRGLPATAELFGRRLVARANGCKSAAGEKG